MRRFQVSLTAAALVIGVTAASLLPSRVTEAATFDIPDGDVAGLIAAINAANADPAEDTINLTPSGIYTLTTVDNLSCYSAPTGLPAITSQITINGNGATIQRSSAAGTPDFRIFFIAGPNIGDLTLNNVAIKGGAVFEPGGGICNWAGKLKIINGSVAGNRGDGGGGVYNMNGTAELVNSTVSNNSDRFYGAGISNDGYGAVVTLTNSSVTNNNGRLRGTGIYNLAGTATLINSTVSGNTNGAGIFNYLAGSKLTLINSTVSGNTHNPTEGGGGVTNIGGITTLINSTVTGNTSLAIIAGGVINNGGTLSLKNTIVANNSVSDCYGLITIIETNLVKSPVASPYGACSVIGSGTLIGGDPLLGPLSDNGGPTRTHAPLLGSPVIDAVPLAVCTDASGAPLTRDQRGVLRPQGVACDIGAVESLPMDTTPPDTTITSGPLALTNSTNATFAFASSEAGTFQCSLDGGAFVACASPTDYIGLADGPHSFQVRATDTAGNIDPTPASSTWTVDTTEPALTVPANITVEASSPSGAVITYAASAHDAMDGTVVPVCTPAPGSTFVIGTTTVSCTATDAAGNATMGAFSVHVSSASEQAQTLANFVTGVGPGASLSAIVQNLQAQIAAGNTTAACNSIQTLLSVVGAQTGKKLTQAQADVITEDANRIAAIMGC